MSSMGDLRPAMARRQLARSQEKGLPMLLLRNLGTFVYCLRSITTYLVSFGTHTSSFREENDSDLFAILSPLTIPENEFSEYGPSERAYPVSFREMMSFLEEVTPVEIVAPNLLPRLKSMITEIEGRWDRGLATGIEGVRSISTSPPPMGTNHNDWLLANTILLGRLVGKLFTGISLHCTRNSCPEMEIEEGVLYMWNDEVLQRGIVLSASEYTRNFFRWFNTKTRTEVIQRGDQGEEYAQATKHLCSNLLMKMARIIAHIKFKHLNGKGGGKGSIAPSLSRKDEGNIFRATSIAYKDDLKSLLSQEENKYNEEQKSKKVSPKIPKKKRPRTVNIPLALYDMTDYLLREGVETNFEFHTKDFQKESRKLLHKYHKDKEHSLSGSPDPCLIMSAVGLLLQQMKDPILLPEYTNCFAVALTLPNADIRLACVQRTLQLIRGKPRELLIFMFSFFNSLIEEKGIDPYDISAFFGPLLMRNTSESLSTAIASLILTDFSTLFRPELQAAGMEMNSSSPPAFPRRSTTGGQGKKKKEKKFGKKRTMNQMDSPRSPLGKTRSETFIKGNTPPINRTPSASPLNVNPKPSSLDRNRSSPTPPSTPPSPSTPTTPTSPTNPPKSPRSPRFNIPSNSQSCYTPASPSPFAETVGSVSCASIPISSGFASIPAPLPPPRNTSHVASPPVRPVSPLPPPISPSKPSPAASTSLPPPPANSFRPPTPPLIPSSPPTSRSPRSLSPPPPSSLSNPLPSSSPPNSPPTDQNSPSTLSNPSTPPHLPSSSPEEPEEDNFGTFVLKSCDKTVTSSAPDNFGTFVMNGESEEVDIYGTFVMPSEQNLAATAMVDCFLEAESEEPKDSKPAKYREPEIWEKNLVSLSQGEWGDDMQDSAFHRYKKTRRNLGEIFNKRQSVKEQNNQIKEALDNHEAQAMQDWAKNYKRASRRVDFEALSYELNAGEPGGLDLDLT